MIRQSRARYLRGKPLDLGWATQVNSTSWTVAWNASTGLWDVTYAGAGAVETIQGDSSGLFLLWPTPMVWGTTNNWVPGHIEVCCVVDSGDTNGMGALVGLNSSGTAVAEFAGRRIERISAANMRVDDCSSIQAAQAVDGTQAKEDVERVRVGADPNPQVTWLQCGNSSNSIHDFTRRNTTFTDYTAPDTVYPCLAFTAPAGGGVMSVGTPEVFYYPYP